VDQALEFLLELNRDRNAAPSAALPTHPPLASPSVNLPAHQPTVGAAGADGRRLGLGPEARLRTQQPDAGLQEVGAALARGAAQFDQPLAPRHRVLSPSDFGFHNALLAPDNRLRFFDLNTPAGTIPADDWRFFLPAANPGWPGVLGTVRGRSGARLNLEDGFAQRARRCLPALRIKWC